MVHCDCDTAREKKGERKEARAEGGGNKVALKRRGRNEVIETGKWDCLERFGLQQPDSPNMQASIWSTTLDSPPPPPPPFPCD